MARKKSTRTRIENWGGPRRCGERVDLSKPSHDVEGGL